MDGIWRRCAFLQGEEIDRELYMDPPLEEKKMNIIWKLKKAVYGLNDASRKWWLKCTSELLSLGCVCSRCDPALFYYYNEQLLAGMVCLHVDDELGCGSDAFRTKVWNKLDERMVVGKTDTEDVIRYVGLNVKQVEGCVMIDQQHFVEKMELISNNELTVCTSSGDNEELVNEVGQSIFKAKVGALNWLATQTRPDLAYEVTEFSTCFKKAKLRNLKDVNKCIKKMKSEEVCVTLPKMVGDVSMWSLLVYSDGAFANLPDKISSTGGHIMFLRDGEGNVATLKWCVNKIQRVVRSSLASEALTSQEAIEDAVFMKEVLCEVFGEEAFKIKINLIVDSKSLKDAIHSTSLVKDKLLRINMAAIKQMVDTYGIVITWKPGCRMIADALSKKQSKKEMLLKAVGNGFINQDQ